MFRGDEDSATLEDILALRANRNGAYKRFCSSILAGAMGMNPRKWLRATATRSVTDVCNSVEETFVLLELENNWAVWKEIAEWLDDNPGMTEKDMGKPKNHPIYTTRPDPNSGGNNNNTRLVEGWSVAGHNRYAELHAKVLEDRGTERGKNFESMFKQSQGRILYATGGTPPTRKRKADEIVVASTGVNLLGELLAAVTPTGV